MARDQMEHDCVCNGIASFFEVTKVGLDFSLARVGRVLS